MNTISIAFTPIMAGERQSSESLPANGFILECHSEQAPDCTPEPDAGITYRGANVGHITSVTRSGRDLLVTGVIDTDAVKVFRTLKARRIHRADIDITGGILHALTFVSPEGPTPSLKDTESSIDATRRAQRILAAYRNDTL